MRQADALRLGDEPEEAAVAVEAPRAALFSDLEPRLVVAVEQLVGDLAGRIFVGQFERFRAEPLHADDGDEAIRQDASHGGVGLEVFELAHLKVARADLLTALVTAQFFNVYHAPLHAILAKNR